MTNACPEGLEPPTIRLEGGCSNPAELRAESYFGFFFMTPTMNSLGISFLNQSSEPA